jgi:hypothetical protein
MAGRVPAIPILSGSALHFIGITGTRPVMPQEGDFQLLRMSSRRTPSFR